MNTQDAMKILVMNTEAIGEVDDIKVLVTAEDIRQNLINNDFELDLEWVQDLTSMESNGDCGMYQGHTLEEINLFE